MNRFISRAIATLKRRTRFNLATLFVLVAISAVFCAVVGNRVRHTRAMRAVVDNVIARGGTTIIRRPGKLWDLLRLDEWGQSVETIRCDHTTKFGNSTGHVYHSRLEAVVWPDDNEPLPKDYFSEYDMLRSKSRRPGKLDDETLALLAAVGPDLRYLDLASASISDDGMRHIARCSNLRMLFLTNVRITDIGAAALASLENLEVLDLKDTAITDATLERLAGLPNLRWLRVEAIQVTPDGIRKLKQARPDLKVTPDPDC